MTPQQIQIAVAEACGWNHVHYSQNLSESIGAVIVRGQPKWAARKWYETVPNYHSCLNAIAEARKTLTETERDIYAAHLVKITGWNRGCDSVFAIADATAAQHAQAFLRTKGLWREGEK